MLDLLATYSISQIFIFVVMFVIALKFTWEIVDFFKIKYREKFNKDYSQLSKEEKLEKHYIEVKDRYSEALKLYSGLNKKIENLNDTINNKFESIEKQINILTESDMHDIKQSIVKDYHYFVEKQKWIDDFSLNTLLLRFEDYQKEGGNSYISTLVEELKTLPKHP